LTSSASSTLSVNRFLIFGHFPINYPGLKIIHKNCEINKGIRQIEDSFRESREKRPQGTRIEGKCRKGRCFTSYCKGWQVYVELQSACSFHRGN
jgi:hypothetical protein